MRSSVPGPVMGRAMCDDQQFRAACYRGAPGSPQRASDALAPRGFAHDTPTGASCSEHEGKRGSTHDELAMQRSAGRKVFPRWPRRMPRRKDVAMLSVNGYTGAAWPHIWHGDYLGELTDSEV
jgi:hypothetical protein